MPVYGSHRVPHDRLEIGRRLRQARQRRGLTLRELSQAAGLSIAALSQIETERRPLDVEYALALAAALGVAIDELVSEQETVPYQIVRGDEWRVRETHGARIPSPAGMEGQRLYALAHLFAGRRLEPIRGFAAAWRAEEANPLYSEREQAFLLVLRGTLEFRVKTPEGILRHELEAGDSLFFWSSLPHAISSLERERAEMLQVFASGPGSFRHEPACMRAPQVEGGEAADRLVQIGRRLKRCRLAADQTAAQVATLIGVTPRQIERAESGRRPLDLSAMVRFAQVFGYPLGELMAETTARPPYVVVQRAAEIASIAPVARCGATSPVNIFRRLNAGLVSPLMFPCLIQVPTTDAVAMPHEHHGEEFVYVLSGQLELSIGSGDSVRTETLHAGDSCYMDATVPHVLKGRPLNPYDRLSAEVIDVFWCPLGEKYLFTEPAGASAG
jgi:transcriptional regulator with XRE-family HTH domain